MTLNVPEGHSPIGRLFKWDISYLWRVAPSLCLCRASRIVINILRPLCGRLVSVRPRTPLCEWTLSLILGGGTWGAMTLKFELGLYICTMHLPTKFHYPMFNRLEVIVLTKRRCWKHPPRSATVCYAGGKWTPNEAPPCDWCQTWKFGEDQSCRF